MTAPQVMCLFFMFMIGGVTLNFATDGDMPRRKRRVLIACAIFWLGPPLYFVWTKGVLG